MDRPDVDRQLHAAAEGDPELAALLAGRHDDPRARYRRLASVVGATALAVLVAWGAARGFSRSAKPHETAEVDYSVYLPPIKTQPASRGVETSPFAGFAVSIETDPSGAVVSIGGQVRGEAPVLADVGCRAAEKIEVRAEKPGFRPVRRELSCRADTLVKLTLRLER